MSTNWTSSLANKDTFVGDTSVSKDSFSFTSFHNQSFLCLCLILRTFIILTEQLSLTTEFLFTLFSLVVYLYLCLVLRTSIILTEQLSVTPGFLFTWFSLSHFLSSFNSTPQKVDIIYSHHSHRPWISFTLRHRISPTPTYRGYHPLPHTAVIIHSHRPWISSTLTDRGHHPLLLTVWMISVLVYSASWSHLLVFSDISLPFPRHVCQTSIYRSINQWIVIDLQPTAYFDSVSKRSLNYEFWRITL